MLVIASQLDPFDPSNPATWNKKQILKLDTSSPKRSSLRKTSKINSNSSRKGNDSRLSLNLKPDLREKIR